MGGPNAALRRDMEAKGIDLALSLQILEDYNAGLYDGVKPVRAKGVPAIDGHSVVAMNDKTEYALPEAEAEARLAGLGLPTPDTARRVPAAGGGGRDLVFPRAALVELGERLYTRTAYGVLNGGSATSYADRKKNLAFGAEAFEALATGFETLAPLCKDRPKGLTPAYLNPDGSPGASFLALKMRARLVALERCRKRYGADFGKTGPSGAGEGANAGEGGEFLPLFQMASVGNRAELEESYASYEKDPLLGPLAARLGVAPCSFRTGVQPMISAYTHSEEGRPKRLFDRAYGAADTAIALPGGHGQC
ncbi:MAG: hypothetical protein JNG85_00195, partial [Spirochaetaceae bacterium]|nr:hypothetical protein [Spirochaetaceae bacterium]